jgi:hypothetical protein
MAEKRKSPAKRREHMAEVDEATIRLHIAPLAKRG